MRSFSRSRHAASPFVVARVVERSTHSLTHSSFLSTRVVVSAATPAALESDDWTAFEEAVDAFNDDEKGKDGILAIEKATSLVPSLVAALESGAVDDGKTAFKFLNAYEELLSATIECLSTRTKQSQNVMKKATKENPDDPESWETTPFAEFPEFANWSAAHPDWTLKDMKKDCKAVNDVSNNVVASMSTFLGAPEDKLAESGLLESAEETLEEAVELKASQKHKKLMDKTFDETR